MACVFALCNILTKVAANNVYAATLNLKETFIFLVAAIANAISAALVG